MCLPIELSTKTFLFFQQDSTLGLLFALFQDGTCSKASLGPRLIYRSNLFYFCSVEQFRCTQTLYHNWFLMVLSSPILSKENSPIKALNILPLFCKVFIIKKGVSHLISFITEDNTVHESNFPHRAQIRSKVFMAGQKLC